MKKAGPNASIGNVPPVAVILAAGEGCRLRDQRHSQPKPLTSVAGLSLAERCVCGLRDAGIRQLVVVLGHDAERVRSHFESIGRRRDSEITFVAAEEWSRGNGSSALAAGEAVRDSSFLLTMVDHLLSAPMFEAILASPPSPGEIALAVDGCKERVFDPSDLTKVCRQDGRVAAIGKDLVEWDASDTGLFYCTDAFFGALERARAKGAHSLTDGVRECIQAGGVRAVDVSGQPWLDVDTPQAVTEAERRIRASLCKGGEDGFISTHFNRAISRPISMLLVRTPITPDQISVGSFLLALLGAAFLALAGSSSWIAGGLIIQAASILDGCDGEIARLKKNATARGAWLDTMLDRYSDLAVAFAVTYAYTLLDQGAWVWIAGASSGAGFVLSSYVTKEYQLRFGVPYPIRWLNNLKRRDLRILVIAMGAVAGCPFFALLLIGAVSHLVVLAILGSAWLNGRSSTG